MIQLFNVNNHIIDTSEFSNMLHDDIVTQYEKEIANYVGNGKIYESTSH